MLAYPPTPADGRGGVGRDCDATHYVAYSLLVEREPPTAPGGDPQAEAFGAEPVRHADVGTADMAQFFQNQKGEGARRTGDEAGAVVGEGDLERRR
jgi:hypothetical protein